MNPTIQLQHIQKSFGHQTVLKDVNLTVNPGEIVGLIGPSGAGKTTIIKTMLGMEEINFGTALVLGRTMPDRRLLSRIGYMAQSDALYSRLSARENIAFFGKMKGVFGKKLANEITHVSQVVDLTENLDQRISGIALLGQPDLLVLDEPTVGIDPALRRQIWHELGLLRDQGQSVLITTHVMDEAEHADRVALLLHGDIIAFAPPQKLEQQYQVPTIEDVFLKAEKEDQQ